MNRRKLYTGAVVLLALLAAACDMAGPNLRRISDYDGKAAVRVVIGSHGLQSRTVAPAIELAGTDWMLFGGTGDAETLLVEFSDEDGTVYLEPGTWNFTLKGYKDDNLILSGSLTERTISLDSPNTLEFIVAPVFDGEGTVSIVIQLPYDSGITEARIFRDGAPLTTDYPVTPNSDDQIVCEYPSQPAGDYYFSVRLYKGADLCGVVSEVAQVRDNLESTITYALTMEDLNRKYTVTFDAQGGSVSPSTISVNSGECVTSLPNPTKSGSTFDGWYTYYNGGGSQFTINTPVPGDITVYAQWDNRGFLDILYGGDDNNSGDSNEGVYVGIISFNEDATVITSPPILLNRTNNYYTLKDKIANEYTRNEKGGTAMFLAVHRALADLTTNAASYPANLDTVSIITFTDGLDNQSAEMLSNPDNSDSPNYLLEGQSFPTVIDEESFEVSGGLVDYSNYIKDQIATRTIAGKNIKAYSIGIMGSDIKRPDGTVTPGNQALFNERLQSVATTGTDPVSDKPYFTLLNNFDEVKKTFKDIAESLNVVYVNTRIVMTTTQNAGATYRWTFDAPGMIDADASTRYIEAMLRSDASGLSLIRVTYAGGISADQTGSIPGSRGEEGIDFVFTNVQGYDAVLDAPNTKQWLKPPGSNDWQGETEIKTTGRPDSHIEHKTAVIYLVLDASTSLTAEQIASIKTAISN